MTEDQIPLMAITAFFGGIIAIAFGRKGPRILAIFAAAVILNMCCWSVYGFAVNWRADWGVAEVVGGLLYSGIGILILSLVSAFLGLSAAVLFQNLKRTPWIQRVCNR